MKIKQISITQSNSIIFTYSVNDKEVRGNISQNKIYIDNISLDYIKNEYHKEFIDWEMTDNIGQLIEKMEIILTDHQEWLIDPQQFKQLISEIPNIKEDMQYRLLPINKFQLMDTREWKDDDISQSDQNLFDQIEDMENYISQKIGDYQPDHWKLIYLVVTNIKVNFKGQIVRLIKLGETTKSIEEYLKSLYVDYEKRIGFKAQYALRMFNYSENGSSVLDKIFHKQLLHTVPQTKVYLQASSSKSKSKVTYRREFYYLTQEFVNQVRQILSNHVDEHYQKMKDAMAKIQAEPAQQIQPNLFTTDDSFLHQFVKQEVVKQEIIEQSQTEQKQEDDNQKEKPNQVRKQKEPEDQIKNQIQQHQEVKKQEQDNKTSNQKIKIISIQKQFVESDIYEQQENQFTEKQEQQNLIIKQNLDKEEDTVELHQIISSSKIEESEQQSQILSSEIIFISNNQLDQKVDEKDDSNNNQTIKSQVSKTEEKQPQQKGSQEQKVKPQIQKAESVMIIDSDSEEQQPVKYGQVINDFKEEQKQVLQISQQGYESVMQKYNLLKTKNNFLLHNLLRAQVKLEQS